MSFKSVLCLKKRCSVRSEMFCNLSGLIRGGGGLGRARSPCVSFPILMSILSKSLDRPRMNVILTTYVDFRV